MEDIADPSTIPADCPHPLQIHIRSLLPSSDCASVFRYTWYVYVCPSSITIAYSLPYRSRASSSAPSSASPPGHGPSSHSSSSQSRRSGRAARGRRAAHQSRKWSRHSSHCCSLLTAHHHWSVHLVLHILEEENENKIAVRTVKGVQGWWLQREGERREDSRRDCE